MFCKKCGNEIKNGEKKCSKCGASVKSKKPLIILTICVVICIIIAVVFVFKDKNNILTIVDNGTKTNSAEQSGSGNNSEESNESDGQKIQSSSANASANGIDSTSFANLKADDNSYDKTQKAIIDYFDSNYFIIKKIEKLQKYPQIYKGARISTNAEVIKVIKSTDEDFEVLAVQGGTLGAYVRDGSSTIIKTGYGDMSISEIPENELMIIKGKQRNKRLIKGDVIQVFARYNDVDNFDIDGKSFVLPVLNTINMVQYSSNDENNYRFNLDTIKTVAEYIFGKDIKISSPVKGEDYNEEAYFTLDPFYKVTLDNQSNANFSAFNMYRNYGVIQYNDVSKNTAKFLFVASDFQHYIVTTYDKNLRHLYVDYYDRDLKKIWAREFDYNSTIDDTSPIDYTSKQIAMVIDNDLHLLDIETGEDIISPVLVGSKIRLNMMEDGIILIGNDNKDTIMKVGYDGKIIFRTNGNTTMSSIYNASTQIVNNKMVIYLEGTEASEGMDTSQYIVVNADGTIETSTND